MYIKRVEQSPSPLAWMHTKILPRTPSFLLASLTSLVGFFTVTSTFPTQLRGSSVPATPASVAATALAIGALVIPLLGYSVNPLFCGIRPSDLNLYLIRRYGTDEQISAFLGLDVWKGVPTRTKRLAEKTLIHCFRNQETSLKLHADISHLPLCLAQYFPQLAKLDLSHNKLENVEILSSLPSLIDLNLSHNQLSCVDKLSPLSSLIHLNLSHNKMRNWSGMSHLHFLKTLDLSHNQLTHFCTLKPHPSLKELSLQHNELKRLYGIENYPNLTYLNLSYNKFTTLSGIEACTRLHILDLSSNHPLRKLECLLKLPSLLECRTLEKPSLEMEHHLAWNQFLHELEQIHFQDPLITHKKSEFLELKERSPLYEKACRLIQSSQWKRPHERPQLLFHLFSDSPASPPPRVPPHPISSQSRKIQNQLFVFQHSSLEDILRIRGKDYWLETIDGSDGSCLFRSVAHFLQRLSLSEQEKDAFILHIQEQKDGLPISSPLIPLLDKLLSIDLNSSSLVPLLRKICCVYNQLYNQENLEVAATSEGKSVSKYLRDMKTDGWGGDLEIAVLAKLLCIRFHIIQDLQETDDPSCASATESCFGSKHSPSLFLFYNGTHYNRFVPYEEV